MIISLSKVDGDEGLVDPKGAQGDASAEDEPGDGS